MFSVLSVALVLSAPSAAQTLPPLPVAESGTQFLVFFRSQPVGREEVLVVRLADGWVVRGTSRLGPPIDITTRVAQIDYDQQWRPKSLLVDGIVRGQDMMLKTTFDGTKASNIIAVQGSPQSKIDPVSADPVVLPNTFLGSYAALARRLQGRTAGSELRAYIAPQMEVTGARGIGGARAHRDAQGDHQLDTIRADVHQSASGRRSRAQPVGG